MAKLAGKRSLARSLALLARGLTVEKAAAWLKAKYHPEASLEQVKRAYFPTRPIPIAQQQGKARPELLRTLQKLKANAERAREKMKLLHQDPTFAKAHAERAREKMKLLHQDPTFAKAHAERMKRLNQDPVFRDKMLAGIARFWNDYRASKQSALKELGYGKTDFEEGTGVTVERLTPEALASANKEHSLIVSAISRLPLLQQAVVVRHFDLEHEVPPKYLQRVETLAQNKREKILKKALKQLKNDSILQKIRKS